jgi:hypothetical protein
MNGNGNSVCYCVVKQTKRLFLKIEKTGGTMSRYQILLEEWDFIGNEGWPYVCCKYFCFVYPLLIEILK